nr:uncharacterized protein LOC112425516 [Macaca nemestrina]
MVCQGRALRSFSLSNNPYPPKPPQFFPCWLQTSLATSVPYSHFPHLSSHVQEITQSCSICHSMSPQCSLQPPPSPTHQPRGQLPGQDWQVDFTHTLPDKRLCYCLVFVCAFSGWVKAFPATSEGANILTQTLVIHISPRFRLPTSIQSNNRPAFISQINQVVSTSLGIKWVIHTPYRPQSSGKVKKKLTVLKAQFIKLALETHQPWTKNLPFALIRLRTTPKAPSFHSLGIMYGQTFVLGPPPLPDYEPLRNYLPSLIQMRSFICEAANETMPLPVDTTLSSQHNCLAGTDVFICQSDPHQKLQSKRRCPYLTL